MDVVEASSFCSSLLSGLKSLCIVFPPHVLSHLVLKAPHATSEKHYLSSLEFGVGVCCVGYVVCGVAFRNKRKEHAPASFLSYEGKKCENVVKNTEH